MNEHYRAPAGDNRASKHGGFTASGMATDPDCTGDLLSQGLRTFYLGGWEHWAPTRRELEVAAVLDALEILVFLIVVPIVVFCVLFTLALFGVIGLVFFAAVPVFALMLVLA